MKVYIVVGGCFGDTHIIGVYKNQDDAEKRAKSENKKCTGLGAYIEEWELL